MVLSDRTIKEELAKGRIVIDPLGEGAVQPASVDVHLDRKLRVFRNSRRPYIDLREDTSDLTEVVEIADEVPFILHPGEFVLASTFEHIELPEDLVARLEGKSSLGAHRAADPLDGRVRRSGMEGAPDAGAEQRGEPSGHALLQDEDRPAFVHQAHDAGGQPVRLAGSRQQVPGPDGADGEPGVPGRKPAPVVRCWRVSNPPLRRDTAILSIVMVTTACDRWGDG